MLSGIRLTPETKSDTIMRYYTFTIFFKILFENLKLQTIWNAVDFVSRRTFDKFFEVVDSVDLEITNKRK